VVGVFVLLVSACSSGDSDSSGTSNSTTGGRIVVADDRAGQDCAADDVGDGEFDEPTYPAPTIPGVEQFTGLTHNHVDGCVDYTQNPPVGGNHREIWQACEFYERAVPPEQAVHSMEHGTVWITYDPSLPASQRATLADFEQDYVLVSPWNRDPLPSPIVASAWGLQLEVDSADDPRLAEFVETYANGPQNTEPGGPCREGGSTETL
jgi:hypothetical protein